MLASNAPMASKGDLLTPHHPRPRPMVTRAPIAPPVGTAALSHGILSEMPSTPAEMAPSPVLADPVLAASAVTAAAAAVGLESSFAAAPAAEPAIDGRQVLKAVAEAEYAELPSYLQTQIDLGFLNEVLEALYDCVSTSGMDPQDVVLSTSQLRDDLGLGEKARVVLLTLIKLKRMKVRCRPPHGACAWQPPSLQVTWTDVDCLLRPWPPWALPAERSANPSPVVTPPAPVTLRRPA